MIKYLLDTNMCIFIMRGKLGAREKIAQAGGLKFFAISEITYAELYYGTERSEFYQDNLNLLSVFTETIEIIPIRKAIPVFAKEKARLKSINKLIDNFDLLIGATAVANNLIMVSENVKHFARIENIKLENWIIR